MTVVGGQAVRPPWETVWKLLRLLYYPLLCSIPKASVEKGHIPKDKTKRNKSGATEEAVTQVYAGM